MSELENLRSLQNGASLTSGQVFDAVFAAGSTLSDNDREADEALEIAIRLLEARRNDQVPQDSFEVIEFLAEECGLYPYIKADRFSLLTQTIIEAHSLSLQQKLYLHSKQMQVLLWLLDGDNVVLSAPTSFGKSLLLDAYVQWMRPKLVLVILPTIALIDETRRRLAHNFPQYRIITNVGDSYDDTRETFFILTQERFLQRNDKIQIDFLFVDEFYKLDPDRDDQRFETLNLALYRALPKAKQTFMAGPHIRSIDLGKRWNGNFRFMRTDYRTVTVNIVDRSKSKETFSTFISDLRSVGDEGSLVFTASPGTAQRLMSDLIEAGIDYRSPLGEDLNSWMQENYHADWPVAQGSLKGLAVHHGRLPRSLGQLFVRLFDAGLIKVLICTSTLIEGVNTVAANVFIYDKKINRTDFDFFSFANIRGRVGRMMRHFVGNAFLYHEPPSEVYTDVDVPILKDPNTASDFLIMNVREDDLSQDGRRRQAEISSSANLSPAILREHGGLGVEMLLSLKEKIGASIAEEPSRLEWSGPPGKNQRIAVAELCLYVAHKRRDTTGIHSERQVAWAWSQLSSVKSLPGYIRWFVHAFFQKDRPAGVDGAFQFLQACEFAFPRTLSAVEALVLEAGGKASYSFFIGGLENWFRPGWMKELDEMGIPLPLAERLSARLGSPKDREAAVEAIKKLDLSSLPGITEIDKLIIEMAAF